MLWLSKKNNELSKAILAAKSECNVYLHRALAEDGDKKFFWIVVVCVIAIIVSVLFISILATNKWSLMVVSNVLYMNPLYFLGVIVILQHLYFVYVVVMNFVELNLHQTV
jgi:cytochrome b subunit of formate dehydrogenase